MVAIYTDHFRTSPISLNGRREIVRQFSSPDNLKSRINGHDQLCTNLEGWFPWVQKHIGLKGGESIFEIGTGTGDLWSKNNLNMDVNLIVSDKFLPMVLGTSAALSSPGVQIDAQHPLPFSENTFDIVVADHMLYLMKDIPHTLKEINRILKPGGRLIASTSGTHHLEDMHKLILGPEATTPMRPFSLENGGHILSNVFPNVIMNEYPDSWLIDTPEKANIFVRYAKSVSMPALPDIKQRMADFEEYVSATISRGESITIPKHSGLFIAKKQCK